jgi:hypothetical protein
VALLETAELAVVHAADIVEPRCEPLDFTRKAEAMRFLDRLLQIEAGVRLLCCSAATHHKSPHRPARPAARGA